MVIVALKDGLGNQLFQYAVGRCLAKSLNTELKFDLTKCLDKNSTHHAFYRLNELNVRENFAVESEIANAHVVKQELVDAWLFMPEVFDSPDNVLLDGYWQSEKYFLEIEDIIRREFTPKNPFGKISAAWKEKILSAKCSVSLHVRHGDFLRYVSRNAHRPLSPEYYNYCVEELRKDYPNLTVFVFSDDLQWCKENLKFDVPTEFVESCESDIDEMFLMSLCKHNIISRGTFSWWGAWLNQNPDKKVFAPEPWMMYPPFGQDIVPENWIKVSKDFPTWTPPMLSIIVYIKNDSPSLELSVTSPIYQKFRDYEIIFVDATTDGSGKICRQFAGNSNVTILTVYRTENKFAALNKALEVARGDYILFLSEKDFIFPETAKTLAVISENFLKETMSSRKNYLTYATFYNYLPNIICSTQYLTGNECDVTDIENADLSVKADNALKDFEGIIEADSSNEEKLTVLFTKNINRYLGTKFFNRKFLAENKIRFTESNNVDAEILFITESFIHTEKIIFISNIFYGRLE